MVLLVSGAVASTAREFVDVRRARGERVGLVQVRMFRSFPAAALRDALRGVPRVAVIDRNCSFGHHGIFFQELKSALYAMDAADRPRAYGYVMGLGGRDIGPRALLEAVRRTRERDLPEPETEWGETDSAMDDYRAYCRGAYEVRSLRQLGDVIASLV